MPVLYGSAAVTVPVLLAVSFVFGTGGQLVNVTVMAVRQAVTPDGMQGRAAATITFVGMGMAPLGSPLGGSLAGEWGLRTSLLVTAAGMMLSPVLMALSPLARLDGRFRTSRTGPRTPARRGREARYPPDVERSQNNSPITAVQAPGGTLALPGAVPTVLDAPGPNRQTRTPAAGTPAAWTGSPAEAVLAREGVLDD